MSRENPKKIEIWLHKFVSFMEEHEALKTQESMANYYTYIGGTNTMLKDWLENFEYDGVLYDTHMCKYNGDEDVFNVFATPYKLKNEIKEEQIERMNNAECPVCGYIDYNCWENQCPDEDYRCPQCKSNLLLEHRFDLRYREEDSILWQRTTLKKIHKPKKIKVVKDMAEVQI